MPKCVKIAKLYCIAAGCRNNDKHSVQTFFRLPSGQSEQDNERCIQWIKLLGREDLLEKKELRKRSYSVCSAHFDDSSMKTIKVLKSDAVPTLLLANESQEGPSCSTAEPMFKDAGTSMSKSIKSGTSVSKIQSTITQIEDKSKDQIVLNNMLQKNAETQTSKKGSSEKPTQTSRLISKETARKRKLIDELKKCKSKQRKLNEEIRKINQELEATYNPTTRNDPADDWTKTYA